jgi:hypothetical protein
VHVDHRQPCVRAIISASVWARLFVEHELGDLVGHLDRAARCAARRQLAVAHQLIEQDLDVDLVVAAVDTRPNCRSRRCRSPAVEGVLDAGQLGDRPRLPPSPTMRAPQFDAVDADARRWPDRRRRHGSHSTPSRRCRCRRSTAGRPGPAGWPIRSSGRHRRTAASTPSTWQTSGVIGIALPSGSTPPPAEISRLS